MDRPTIQPFFDSVSSTLTYVVFDQAARVGVVIDPVRDFDLHSARTSWASAAQVAGFVDARGLRIPYVIDTHAHADHLTGLPFWKERYRARTVTGSRVGAVQEIFREFYGLAPAFPVNGAQFDVLLDEGDTLEAGPLRIRAMHTPGHTPAHMSWRIGDVVFLGDTLFTPDYGTARCDFPGGSASELYDSIQRLYALPDDTRLFVCHDYRPNGRPLRVASSVKEQKAANVQLSAHTGKEDFIAFRTRRDTELAVPALMLPALQVNVRAGALPEPEANGTRYLKLPLDRL